MLDVPYNIPHFDTSCRIEEIGSDEDKLVDMSIPKISKNHSTQVTHLSSPDPTEIILPDSPISESSTLSDPHTPQPKPTQKAARSNEVSASLNTANIISEGVGRSRQASRKDTYASTLEKISQGKVDAFHGAF